MSNIFERDSYDVISSDSEPVEYEELENGDYYFNFRQFNQVSHYIGWDELDTYLSHHNPEPGKDDSSLSHFLIYGRYLDALLRRSPEVLREVGLAYVNVGNHKWLAAVEPTQSMGLQNWLPIALALLTAKEAALYRCRDVESDGWLFFFPTDPDHVQALAEVLKTNIVKWLLEDHEFERFSSGIFDFHDDIPGRTEDDRIGDRYSDCRILTVEEVEQRGTKQTFEQSISAESAVEQLISDKTGSVGLPRTERRFIMDSTYPPLQLDD